MMSCRSSGASPDLTSGGQLLGDFEVAITGGFWVAAGVSKNEDTIVKFLKGGGKLRILMAPKNGPLIDSASIYIRAQPSEVVANHDFAMIKLKKAYSQRESGQIEVRLLSLFPSHFLFIKNPEDAQQDSEAQVHLSIFNLESDAAPLFIVRKTDSPERFSAFRKEFVDLWGLATAVDLDCHPASASIAATPTPAVAATGTVASVAAGAPLPPATP